MVQTPYVGGYIGGGGAIGVIGGIVISSSDHCSHAYAYADLNCVLWFQGLKHARNARS